MGARILFRDSQGRDGSIDLDPAGPVYVGRALDCAIRTDDAMVSRKHSMIRMEQSRFYVEDLGSSNGTLVNNVRVSKQPLSHNDVVQCGSLYLRYIEDGPIASPAAFVEPGPLGSPGPAGPAGGFTVPGKQGSRPEYAVGAGGKPIKPATVPPLDGSAVVGMTDGNFESLPPTMGESSVVVDYGGAAGLDSEEARRLRDQLERAQGELEELQARFDREAAEGKRARAESITLRDRIEELKGAVRDREDMVASHSRVAEELREELSQLREELARARSEVTDVRDDLAARQRQLERAQSDTVRFKEQVEDLNRQLAELSRTKDEGWKKLNDQLGEIDHLREVINEQERMLEERRVGLVSQEEAIKELRADKERQIKLTAALRAERDELRTDAGRQAAQIAAIDEENRRLSGLLAELQSRAGGRGGGDTVKLAEELKNARIEVRKLESDRERLQEMLDRADAEIEKLESRLAELEVEVREAQERRDVASSTRSVAEEAMAKAEARARRAEEEALDAAKARDVAMSSADQARREADRLRRHIDQIERDAPGEVEVDTLRGEAIDLKGQLRQALTRARDAETQLERLVAERDAARAEARAKAGPIVDLVDDTRGGDTLAPAGPGADALAERALSVYEDINDILSELRNNIMLVEGEFGEMSPSIEGQRPDSVRIIREAIETLVGNAEDAKGVLRSLKELVE